MANTFFRQFLFHLKWSLWVLLVTAAALAGIWWLLARQNWFGVKPLPWLNLNMVILLIATAVFIPLTMLLRSHETRDLLQKCLLFSILVHVAITMLLSGVSVSRDVIRYVRVETGLEVPINLEASRAAELQLAVRNQITNLPVATPQAGGDQPAQSAIEVNIEPPRPIQNELPRTSAKPVSISPSPGLLVAIPILLVYYYFIRKIERYVAEMNELSIDFADHFLDHAPRRSQTANYETVLKSEV